MLELYWGCFIAGLILALITVVFSQVLDGLLEGVLDWLSIDGPGFLHPISLVGGLTAFGGIGIMLTEFIPWGNVAIFGLTLLLTLLLCIALHFLYVIPMRKAENSTGFSLQDLVGRIGEVTVSIPEAGYGEVMLRAGAGRTINIASSFDGIRIAEGSRVIVIEVKEGVLRVSSFDPDDDGL